MSYYKIIPNPFHKYHDNCQSRGLYYLGHYPYIVSCKQTWSLKVSICMENHKSVKSPTLDVFL